MKRRFSPAALSVFIVLSVLLIDQTIKVWVKLNMFKYESIHVFDWFYIYFTENPGMAFGMEIFGKLFLTLFRLVFAAFIICYLRNIIRKKTYPIGYIVCISFILAGALGNIVDSLFYGEIFTESTQIQMAELVPWGQGYGSLFRGEVVDMFYFPLFGFDWPEWFPAVGGEHFIFFSPIFNFADASISCSLIVLLIFYSKWLNRSFKKREIAADGEKK